MQNSSRHIRRCYRALKRGASAARRYLERTNPPFLNRKRGRWGERVATKYLRGHGVQILETNWRAGGLEADIVAIERRSVLLVEVKTRHHSLQRLYPALGAINPTKRRNLETLARSYLRNHGPLCRRIGAKHHRVDAVEVYYTRGLWGFPRVTDIRWHRGLALPCGHFNAV